MGREALHPRDALPWRLPASVLGKREESEANSPQGLWEAFLRSEGSRFAHWGLCGGNTVSQARSLCQSVMTKHCTLYGFSQRN